ncbi:MAG: glycosyltransferase family 4 protein, partial [Actinomycetota bacterium]
DRPLRILQISARYRPYVGGTEIHTREVSMELASRGHDVTVLTTDPGADLPTEEHFDGVRVIRVRAWPRGADLYLAPGLTKVIGSGDWDLVHVQGYHTAVAPLALWAAQRKGIPTALTFHSGGHSSRFRNMARPFHARAMAPLMRRCKLLIGVSDWETSLFSERLGVEPGRIQTIPNGVSPSTAAETAAVTTADLPFGPNASDGPHLLSIGRLQRYKGHQRIIQAMPRLLQADPRIRLTVIGQGPYRDRLDRLVAKLNLEDSVSFDSVEAEDRPRLDRIMASASAAVFLSEYESHGMAAHEALLAGLPVVVLDATALGGLVAEGLARAVPPMASDAEVASIVLRTLVETEGREPADPRPELERLRNSWPTIARQIE